MSHARNLGIAASTSEWLIFLDADDILLPGTLHRRLEVARDTGADVIVTDWEDVIDDGKGLITAGPFRRLDWEALARDPQAAIASHVWATTAALMYRRQIVDRIGGFRDDLPVIQDARFMFDAAYHNARFAHAAYTGARYRQLPNSLSRRNPARFWRDVFFNGRQIEALWQARGELSPERRRVIANIFDCSAREFLAAGCPEFFAATAELKRLGLPRSKHNRISAPAARLLGLKTAHHALHLWQRR